MTQIQNCRTSVATSFLQIEYVILRRLFLTLLLTSIACAESAPSKPNFVIILTDDQGYGGLGCYGSQDVKTPHIDQMAAEDAKLTSFYMAAPYCTPSRAALMTGSYPSRIGMAGRVCLSADPRGLHPNKITIAEILKENSKPAGLVKNAKPLTKND